VHLNNLNAPVLNVLIDTRTCYIVIVKFSYELSIIEFRKYV